MPVDFIQKSNHANDFFRRNDSITLEQIKNYVLIYELGSLSRAAKSAYKTQPALSQNINKLEEKLNTTLIKRQRGKSISFTEEGHRFYQNIAPALSQLLTQIDEVENRNTLSIGVCDDLPIAIQLTLQRQVAELTNGRVRLICDFSTKIEAMVADGRLSYGIIKKITTASTRAQSFVWAAHQNMQFCDQDRLPIVSAHAGCFIRNVIEDALNDSGRSYYFSYLANHLHHQIEAVKSGFGVGIFGKGLLDEVNEKSRGKDKEGYGIENRLYVLDTKNGFPTLPSYQYLLIGETDTYLKQKIEPSLAQFVDSING